MGQIPIFSRTVLPQRAQYGLADAALREGQGKADQIRQNAANSEAAGNSLQHIQSNINTLKLREAEATNTTWVNENAIQFKRDVVDRLDAARQLRSSNPDKFHQDFDKELETLSNDYAKRAPSEAARIAIKGTLSNVRAAYYDDNLGWEKTRKVAMFGESADRAAENINVLAYRAGQDGKDIEKSGIMNDVNASVIAGSTFVAHDKLASMKDTMSRGAMTSYVEGLMEKNPQKAKELLKSRKYDKVLGADAIQHFEGQIQAQEKAEIRDDISDMDKASSLGLTIPRTTIEKLATRAESYNMTDQATALRKYANIQDTVSTFAKKSMVDQTAELKAVGVEIQNGSMDKVDEYSALMKVYETKQKMLTGGQAWDYYASQGIVSPPSKMNFADPASMAASMKDRRAGIAMVQDLEGFSLPLMTKSEITEFKGVVDSMDPKIAGSVISNMGNTLDVDERRTLAQAFGQTSPLIAAALNQPPDVAQGIMAGAATKGEVSAEKVRQAVNNEINGMVFEPEAVEGVQSAVFAYYKNLSLKAGDTNAEPDEDRIKQAITDVVGKPAEISVDGTPSKIFLYRDEAGSYVSPYEIEDTLSSATDQSLQKSAGTTPMVNGTPVTAKEIREKASFVTSGDGEYMAIIPDLGYIQDDKGQPFIFNVRKIKTINQELGVKPKSGGFTRNVFGGMG